MLSEDCLMHRMRLNYEALADGRTVKSVLEELLTDLGAPRSAATRNGELFAAKATSATAAATTTADTAS